MSDQHKTKAQLISELVALRQTVAERDDRLRTADQAEADQRKINDRIPVLIATAGVDGYYKQVNAAFERILGWSEEESLSRPFLDFVHPEDRPAAVEAFERLKAGDTLAGFVDRNLCKDGSLRTLSWIVIPVLERNLIFGIGQDITERRTAEEALQKAHQELEQRVRERTADLNLVNRKLRREVSERGQAEAALRESHDELAAIYDRMVDGLAVVDMETLRFVRVNASLCRMLGYGEEELLSLSVPDIHPAEALPHIVATVRAVDRLAQPPTAALPVLRKDGTVFHAEVIGNFLVYKGRRCILGMFRDVTERMEAQEAIEREQQTLMHMLQASDHERQTIAYDIHDGLAQQLAAAIMYFQAYDHADPAAPDKAEGAYRAAIELVRLAHAEARRLVGGVRPPALDESGVAVAIAHLVHEERDTGGQQIEYHDDVRFDRLPPVLENAIYRIVQECLSNARRHSRSPRIKVSLVQEGNQALIEVRDWGVGFDPGATPEDRFGLQGVRQRTRLLGGRFLLESRPGQGTRVRLAIPLPPPR